MPPARQNNVAIIAAVTVVVLLLVSIALAYVVNKPAAEKPPVPVTTTTRAHDTERQTAINSMATQLEVYFNDNGGYPQLTQLQDTAWVEANLKGLDPAMLVAPGASGNSYVQTANPTAQQYGFVSLNADLTPCTATQCAKFELFWYAEATNNVRSKSSLN